MELIPPGRRKRVIRMKKLTTVIEEITWSTGLEKEKRDCV